MRSGRTTSRRPRALAQLAAMLLVLGVGGVAAASNDASAAPAPRPRPVAAKTIVSLTFDDGNADQMNVVSTLKTLGLKATFYIISGSIGQPNYLTLPNLQTIAANGNEIAGHTVNHPDLTLVPTDEAQRQICNARATLTGWGFPQTSFAYPYASVNPAVEGIAAACGYNSARGLGDTQTPSGCSGCPFAGTLPPADPYDLAAPDEVDSAWSLATLERAVTNAQTHSGGWVMLTFHHICTLCDLTAGGLNITPTLFNQFALWLWANERLHASSLSVQTVNSVIGGSVKPLVTAPAPPAVSGSQTNSSLEQETAGGPTCWTPYNYGTNAATFTPVSPGHTGALAQQTTISGYVNGAAQLLPTFDTGGCTPSVTAGHSYQLSAWYKSTTVTQFALYYRNPTGGYTYWTSSPYFAAASGWTLASWVTPAVPAGATGLSAGLALFSNGTLTTDDYGMIDAASVPPPTPALDNASLETVDLAGNPDCWSFYGFGTNTASHALSSPGHTGTNAETVTVTSYTDGDAKLLPTQDSSACAPAATPGTAYTLGAWYQSTVATQFIAYYRLNGVWNYWTAGPLAPASATWTQASWTTPALPSGADAISFGLDVIGVGSVTTDDYSMTG